MNCPVCRAVNPEDAERCVTCGQSLASTAHPEAISVPQQASDSAATVAAVDPAAAMAAQQPAIAAGVLTPPPTPTSSGSGSTGSGSSPSSSTISFTLEPGSDFGPRYRIEARLGEGGMGIVYKAYDKELDRTVAIKLLRVGVAAEAGAMQRFKQELLLASKISHKNILRIHDLGDVNGIKFISMAYVEGEDLHAQLRRSGRLPMAQVVKIARQLCGALEAAHAEGVVHRDLKPQNVLIDKADNAYISDFGLAKSIEASAAGMTRTGEFLGTPKYMSPEQVEAKPVDNRSDLYSLGLILYEMAAGQVPFTGDSALQVMYQRVRQKPKNIKTLNPELPDYLARIIMRCLERDPAARYQSAKEILADLDAERASVSAARSVQIALPMPANRLWLALGGVLLVVLAFAIPPVWHLILERPAGSTATKFGVPAEPVSLAIIPFRNASGDRSLDWLGPSLAEMLSTDVGQSSYLRTVPSDRVHQILHDLRITPDSSLDPDTLRRVAEFASADRLLWGQYIKLGDQIRIDATLQHLKTQRTFALKVEAPNEKELPAAVEQLAESVHQSLAFSPDIIKELRSKSLKPSTKSVQALRYYSEGLQLARQGKSLDALKRFEASSKEDPDFALAYAKLGQIYANLGYDDKAQEFSRKAVDLSENLPPQEKYLIGANHARIMKNSAKAIESYENLAKVLPDDLDVQFGLAGLYEDAGSFDKAREHYARVLKADPKNVDALLATGRVETRGRSPQSSLDYLNSALTLAVQLGNDEEKANILLILGEAYSMLQKPDDALRNYEESLAIRRRLGQKRGVADSLQAMAQVQGNLGKLDLALKGYQEALRLRREIGDTKGIGHTLNDLGVLYAIRGQHDQALKLFKEALQIHRAVGREDHEALALNNIGSAYLDKGQYEDARTYYEQALQLREKLKVAVDIAETLHNLAETSTKMGEYDRALAHYHRALDLRRSAGDKRGAAIDSYSMGILFEYQGRYSAAVTAREEALKTFRELQDRSYSMAEILGGYGNALNLIGRSEEAQKGLEEALSLAREFQNQPLVAQTLNFQGDAFFYRGDFKSARALYKQALQVASRNRDHEKELISKFNLAKVAAKEGRSREAISALKKLAQEADTIGLKYLSVECSVYLAEALVNTKDYSHARQELERALGRSEKLGLRTLQAKSHYLLATALRLTGNTAEAGRHYRETLRFLEEMRKEPGAEKLMQRNDLNSLYTDSTRWSQAPTA